MEHPNAITLSVGIGCRDGRAAVSAQRRFAYLFGDFERMRVPAYMLQLALLHAESLDALLPRDTRPPTMQAGNVRRILPLASTSELVEVPLPAPASKLPRDNVR